ncbi:multidrug ABC transporter ATP-binding protein [Sporanaerobium hydrogeniformans]|uniref:Multidrug ABC transporter ATP-binding protein n=1 Tax=Sporanaerobium hydrogeniformans TaxID=3072179 RepID=A0AC61DFS5_9FIRM|nr:ABC transporter ATP-binding protein [Sporanaerobium hydrogeniformans]PHV71633.1 multidrug ABC transporter ATP-binding protein [Sporanaerobium hydrogeniformans]
MTRLFNYLKPYLGFILLAVLLLFGQAMCELALPDYMSNIVNNGIVSGDTGYILKIGAWMLVVSLGSVLCAVAVGFIAARVAAAVAKSLRQDLFEKVESFSQAEFEKFSTASLITRTTNDITQVQMLIFMMIRMMCYAPIMGIGGILRALSKDVSMSWIIALAVIILIGLISIIFSLAMPRFKKVQKLIDRLNLVTREELSGMLVIRAFNKERFEEKRFDTVNKDLAGTQLFVNRTMGLLMPAMMLLMNLVSILIIWIGSQRVAALQIQVGDMMAFMQYAMQIIMSFLMISMMFIMVPRASVSAIRIAEVLETELTIKEPKKLLALPEKVRGEIEFKNVYFRYPDAQEDILHAINFIAKPGQTTAFIGSTGSGKSTLVNLIPRFYDVTQGEILLDGIDIRQVTQQDLREQIGYVPQKAVLFSGTIRSNLAYGKESLSKEVLEEIVETAQVKEFIDRADVGFEKQIAQGGTNVSGGQKQRLCIARALAKQSPVYIFDDSFSALDFKTDALLRAALKKTTADSTVFIVAQRISTIRHAEQIIVLDEGHIVGKGTHKELMKSCEVYREIASSQLSKEELA